MAFVKGTPITTDADLSKWAVFEPNLSKWLSDIDDASPPTDFSQQHIVANDAIMDELSSRGIDPTQVTNTDSFKRAALYFVLAHLYLGRIDEVGDVADIKYNYYLTLFDRAMENSYTEVPADDDVEYRGDVPIVSNIDAKSRFGDLAVGETDVGPYDENA